MNVYYKLIFHHKKLCKPSLIFLLTVQIDKNFQNKNKFNKIKSMYTGFYRR